MLGKRTLVMGVLNVTPDSFSDGGLFQRADAAVARALEMEGAGADIVDIGGESTRPGSEGVSAAEQLRRILPVLEKLRGRLKIPISVDTSSAEVAESAIAAGGNSERRNGFARRSQICRSGGATQAAGRSDAHARRAAHDADEAVRARRAE